MTHIYSEDTVEQAVEDVLGELGWETITAYKNETFGEKGLLGRENTGEVILSKYLFPQLKKLNANVPDQALNQAIEKIAQKVAGKKLGQINKEKYELLKGGVPVSFTNEKGELVKKKLKVFDFNNYENNHFLCVRQFVINGDLYNRRPDVIGFVNGIPLVFMELKVTHKDISNAYHDNLTDYKDTIAHVFHTNVFIILSNGVDAKVGTVTSPFKYFLDWKRIEENEKGIVDLDTMIKGTCAKHRLMDIFENFLLFDSSHGDVKKLMAKNHQYIGVNKTLENVKQIDDLNGKLGVYWHTQGSGKSYSMVFLCEKIHRKLGGSYTFLLAVDRTELENQLYDTFSGVGLVNDKHVVAGKKSGITGREHLRELLAENHKYIFTLIHKFSIDPEKEKEYPLITERKNVIVISDEAHRTQSGTFAANMRFKALPNASFLGFTGTPIIKEEEELTRKIFGEYVSVYDFKRAIEDEATLPLRYQNRGNLLDIENPVLDEKMAEVLENEDIDDDQKRKLAYLFKKSYPVLTADSRLDEIAKDLVWHFNERGYQGKAMFVALDKPTAVKMYNKVMKYWPEYIAELKKRIVKASDEEKAIELEQKLSKIENTEVCVVVSSEQNEVSKFKKLELDIEPHRRKMVERNLEKEFKDPDNPFRLAIVCAMWITGFDAQCVSTIYLDKPIKGHTLMQTIARANRVYDDMKESGLIVDYGNVYQQLEKAYAVYGEGKKGKPGEQGKERPVEELEALETKLAEAIEAVKNHLLSLDFDLDKLREAEPMQQLALLKDAADKVCLNETTRVAFEVMARDVFKKYKALFPDPLAKQHYVDYAGINTIYNQLNTQVKQADVTEIIKELQSLVDEHIIINSNEAREEENNQFIDLRTLNIEALEAAFKKAPKKNTLTYSIQQAIERKLEQMLKENPLRLEFYERYQEIIKDYNDGKSFENTVKAFNELAEFVKELSEEQHRAIKEGLKGQELLAIYDLLREGKELTNDEIKKVKGVAIKTLEELKKEKEKLDAFKQSRQISAQIRQLIYDQLLYLPPEKYPDDELNSKTQAIYQHLYSTYYNGGGSVYDQKVA